MTGYPAERVAAAPANRTLLLVASLFNLVVYSAESYAAGAASNRGESAWSWVMLAFMVLNGCVATFGVIEWRTSS